MKIVEPRVKFYNSIDGTEMLKHIEKCGRTCYLSNDKIKKGTAEQFVANLIKRDHLSPLEHCSFTVKFTCDRAIANEIVRHRIASYSQESTRYANYSNDKFGNEITVIAPCYWEVGSSEWNTWVSAMKSIETYYFRLLEIGCSPQEARSVLPNSLKTELVMTANLREWRHFLKLRCDKAAHPQIRELGLKLLKMCQENIPIVFDDLSFDEKV